MVELRVLKGGGPCSSCSMPSCLSYSPRSIKPPLRRPSFPPIGRASPHAAAFPFCAALLPPPAPRPPVRPTFLSPRCRGLLAAFTRGAARRYADPRSASRRSGIAAPASATAQPLARLGAACAGGWPSSPRRHAFGVHGWAPGGTRSRGARSPRGPVPCGQSGPREDRRGVLRGSLPRSSALRASGGGARWNAVRGRTAASPTPPPIRARPDTLRGRGSLTRVVQIRRNGGFPTPLVRPRLFSPFFGSFGRSGA